MLDDIKMLHDRDTADALGSAERQWRQLGHVFDITQGPAGFNHILYAGVGDAILAAEMYQSVFPAKVPFEMVQDHDIPAYVSSDTLCIAASYRGDDQEVISVLNQAVRAGALCVGITSGGAVADTLPDTSLILPPSLEPRFAKFAQFKALSSLLQTGELPDMAEFLQSAVTAWLPTVRTEHNLAKQLALEVIGKTPIIYSGSRLHPAAHSWKQGFNQNAKHLAWTGQYPSFNHDELSGWSKQPIHKPFTIIELRSSFDRPDVKRAFEVSDRLLSGQRPAPYRVEVQGETPLEQLLWAMLLGDFVTIYTGLLSGIDPTPLVLADKAKKILES